MLMWGSPRSVPANVSGCRCDSSGVNSLLQKAPLQPGLVAAGLSVHQVPKAQTGDREEDEEGNYSREEIIQTINNFKRLKLQGEEGDLDWWYENHSFDEFIAFVIEKIEEKKGPIQPSPKESEKISQEKKDLNKQDYEYEVEMIFDTDAVSVWAPISTKQLVELATKPKVKWNTSNINKIDISKKGYYVIRDNKTDKFWMISIDGDGKTP